MNWGCQLGVPQHAPPAPPFSIFNVGKIEAPRGSLTRQEKNTRFCSDPSSKLAGNVEIGGAGGSRSSVECAATFYVGCQVSSCL